MKCKDGGVDMQIRLQICRAAGLRLCQATPIRCSMQLHAAKKSGEGDSRGAEWGEMLSS